MKDDVKNAQSKHSDSVVRNHVLWSMGAGAFIPVPILDSVGVAAIQLDMVRQLSRVYNIAFEDTKYKAIVTSILGTFLARAGAKSLIKLIPIAGSYVGGAAMGILAGASTYTLGELFKSHFENGGTMLDVDVSRMKRQFAEKFEKNKEVVQKIKEEHEKNREQGEEQGGFSEPIFSEEQSEKGEPQSDDNTTSKMMNLMEELERLAALKEKGILSEEEFQMMKKKLMG